MRILLTGATGQLGWELQRSLATLGEVVATDRRQLDLGKPLEAARFIRQTAPQIIVNAAAYTAVDAAEADEAAARVINAITPAAMAEEARKLDALMVHFSTDYVFDGCSTTPYTETGPARPLNAYGRTKAEGEQGIRQSGARHLILRSAWIYGARGRNFLLTVLRLAREQERLRVVNDQLGCPTWSRTIANCSTTLLSQLAREPLVAETLHLSCSGAVSWQGFASAIIQRGARLGLCPLKPVEAIRTIDRPTPAQRPAYSVLDSSRLKTRFGIELPNWEAALDQYFEDMALSNSNSNS